MKILSNPQKLSFLFIAKLALIVLLKLINIPALFYNAADPTADYHFFKPLYTFIPQSLAMAIFLSADLLTAYLLKSYDFLYYSLLTPLDSSSIINLVLILFPKNKLVEINIISSHCHLPSFNAFWFSTMMMTKQFSYFYRSLLVIYQFFFTLKDPRLIILFLSPSTFKNYLLVIHRSRFISLYTILYIVFLYYLMDERVAARYHNFVSLALCFLYIVEIRHFLGKDPENDSK